MGPGQITRPRPFVTCGGGPAGGNFAIPWPRQNLTRRGQNDVPKTVSSSRRTCQRRPEFASAFGALLKHNGGGIEPLGCE